MNEEGTIGVMLEGLDDSPPVLKGLTSTELLASVGILSLIHSSSWVIIFFAVSFPFYIGIPVGIGTGVIHTFFFAGKIALLKQGRPSYLMWGELFRKWQFEGMNIIGFKVRIPIGPKFIRTQVWDNCSKELD